MTYILPFLGLWQVSRLVRKTLYKNKFIIALLLRKKKYIIALDFTKLVYTLIIILLVSSIYPSAETYRAKYLTVYIDPKTYSLFRTWDLSPYARPIILMKGLYYGAALSYMNYLMMLHGDIYFYYGSVWYLFNLTEDSGIADIKERSLSKFTVFLLEQNNLDRSEIKNHHVLVSHLLYQSVDIPEEYVTRAKLIIINP